MKTRKTIYTIIAIAILASGWALFRPERLVVNARVNESFPETNATNTSKSSSTLASGAFHSVLHDGKGTATIYQLEDGKRVLRLTGKDSTQGGDR